MNRRNLILAVSTLAVLAAATLLVLQQQTLSGLRTQEFALQTAIQSERPATPASAATPSPAPPATTSVEPLTDAERTELLRLRSEVTTLNQRRSELASVEQRHDALKAQLAKARVNPKRVEAVVPEGYILRTKARNAGLATPEAALETFLWALANRDMAALLATMDPNAPGYAPFAEKLNEAEAEIWDDMSNLPGIQIAEKSTDPDGSVSMRLALIPGEEGERAGPLAVARLVDGQWKLDLR